MPHTTRKSAVAFALKNKKSKSEWDVCDTEEFKPKNEERVRIVRNRSAGGGPR